MPSGVRARAREERARQAVEAAAARSAAQARAVRGRERRARLVRLLPSGRSSSGRQSGAFARRRRIQVQVLIVALVLLNALLWFAEPSPSIRALALVASVLTAPVLYTVLFRKA